MILYIENLKEFTKKKHKNAIKIINNFCKVVEYKSGM